MFFNSQRTSIQYNVSQAVCIRQVKSVCMLCNLCNTWQRLLIVIHTVNMLVSVRTGVCLQGHGDDLSVCFLCVCDSESTRSRCSSSLPKKKKTKQQLFTNCAKTERDEQCSFPC